MKKETKMTLLYWISIYACLAIGFAIAIIIGVSREPLKKAAFDRIIASDYDKVLMAELDMLKYMTTLYCLIPIMCGFILGEVIDFFTKKRLINRYPILYFSIAIIFNALLCVMIYAFREALVDTIFAAIWHLLPFIILSFIAILFKKKPKEENSQIKNATENKDVKII